MVSPPPIPIPITPLPITKLVRLCGPQQYIRHRACANGVPRVCLFCLAFVFPACCLTVFFTVGMFTVGMFTVGMFTVGLVLFVLKGVTPTSPAWIRRVSRFGVIFWH